MINLRKYKKKVNNLINNIISGEYFNWIDLRNFGKSKVLRSSYIWFIIVPIFAKILSQINFPLDIILKIFDSDLIITVSLPFSWKLFYYSSVCFTIATTIFIIFCPAIIKNYKNFHNFKKQKQSDDELLSHIEELTEIEYADSNKEMSTQKFTDFLSYMTFLQEYTDVEFTQSQIESYNKNPPDMKNIPLKAYKISSNKIEEAFRRIQYIADKKFPKIRLVCGLFFVLGFVFIGWVMIENFLCVVRMTF